MVIEEKDFRVTSKEGFMGDLEFPYIVNKGKDNERVEFKIAFYGIPMKQVITEIAANRISVDWEDETIVTLNKYLEIYAKYVNEVDKLLKPFFELKTQFLNEHRK